MEHGKIKKSLQSSRRLFAVQPEHHCQNTNAEQSGRGTQYIIKDTNTGSLSTGCARWSG
jgi:hypothetical protein